MFHREGAGVKSDVVTFLSMKHFQHVDVEGEHLALQILRNNLHLKLILMFAKMSCATGILKSPYTHIYVSTN